MKAIVLCEICQNQDGILIDFVKHNIFGSKANLVLCAVLDRYHLCGKARKLRRLRRFSSLTLFDPNQRPSRSPRLKGLFFILSEFKPPKYYLFKKSRTILANTSGCSPKAKWEAFSMTMNSALGKASTYWRDAASLCMSSAP